MNLSEEFQIKKLKETQEVIFQHLLPAIVALVIFCFIGIIGNIVTIIFYAQRSGRSSTFLMITSLAAVDLGVCVAMILSIWELAALVTSYYSALCKVTHFFGRWSVGSSCFVLWIITVDRYRKICKPFKKQVTILKAKQFVAAFVTFALLLSFKELIHYKSIKIPLTAANSNETINGYYCREQKGSGYKISIFVFNAIDVLLFVFIWVSQIVVYILIIYNLVKIRNKKDKIKGLTFSMQTTNVSHGNNNSTMDGGTFEHVKNISNIQDNVSFDKTFEIDLDDSPRSEQNTSISLNSPEPTNQEETPHKEFSKHYSTEKVELSTEKPPNCEDNSPPTSFPDNSKGQGHLKRLSQIEMKLTLMLFTVSLVFILCFTPYFVLVTWAFTSGKDFELDAGIKFAIRLPFLNSVFNPLVYFAFNAEFRCFVKRFVQKKCLFCRENA